ncbi:MAG TPA: phosphoribosylformylglycinamidine synthase subunit PurS [Methylomirabilota bacterium]|nr:phosphoribosylformylglycinamidine synthase subunit PurS [Methylomirabilota bacterium]
MSEPAIVKARVLIRLKQSILDAQGASVKRALQGLGFSGVRDVRVGKVLDLDLDGESQDEVRRRIEEMCARLLVNPVIEEVTVEVLGQTASGSCQK